MKLTWLGHAAFLLEGRDRIAVDPFISGNENAKTTPDQVECDIVAVTHGHGDHLGDTITIAKKNDAPVVSIAEISEATGMPAGTVKSRLHRCRRRAARLMEELR